MLIGIDASRVVKEEKTGTENYSWNLIHALAGVDKKNRYVLYFNKSPRFFEISQANFSTKIITSPRFWTQGRLALECLIHPPDILFVPAHTIPVLRWPGLKTIVTVHDLGAEFLAEYHKFPQKLYLNWSTKYVAKNANHLIAVSNFTKKDLIRALKVPASRISVVYEGVDGKVFYPRPDWEVKQVKSNWGIGKGYFLYVGTIQPRKNLVRLMEAFTASGLKNIDLVLAGSSGWLDEEIYKAPEKLSISNRVRFLGYVESDDLPALYSGAIGLAFPSLYEGFGLPILEAFTCGCPVLTSKIGAMAEVAGDAALLVDPLSKNEIAAGLKKLVTDKGLRESLIKKGEERVKEFSWEKTAIETIKVFEKVYGG
ncbi:MAG: Glycosyl transferase group 1 [Candidatus Woesebacteria bacterium GW2011_GWA1_45_8]|uniref:Glycosyl transferase group 1 n=1 Tax=Candidatus Woesebacteria bacterium GW2011_GWA1_45_8 TaxID=1618559 RepID=A0A0G1Q3G0_9BACT|nr:MAG: Glycosyl transferase group 1 [Candidatus Woesebacteria bacterium GW2011_GWA1_45_8]